MAHKNARSKKAATAKIDAVRRKDQRQNIPTTVLPPQNADYFCPWARIIGRTVKGHGMNQRTGASLAIHVCRPLVFSKGEYR